MTKSAESSAARHYVNYLGGNILVLLAGFISFPILTRLLDNHEYGVLGYYDTWWMLLAALVKLGAQQSILHYWPHGGSDADRRRFTASFVLWPAAISTTLWLVSLLVFGVVMAVDPPTQPAVALLVLLTLPGIMLMSFVEAALTAQQRSGQLMARRVTMRWADLFFILLVVWFFERSALGTYIGRFIVVAAFALWCIHWLRRELPLDWRAGRWVEVKTSLAFGLPLVVNEISHVLLAFSDRFVLKYLLGFEAVGIYTIGYALAIHVNFLVRFTVAQAFNQMATREYATGGAAAVVRLKHETMHVLVFVVTAIAIGAVWVGDDLLLALAGIDKAASAPIFQWIAITYVGYAVIEIAGYGLLLQKRSGLTLALTIGSLAVNLLLNFLLIPQFGVMGAVYATVAAYAVLGLAQYGLCPRELRALPGLRGLVLAIALAALTHAVASATDLFQVEAAFGRVAAMALLMVFTFAIPAVAIDPALRRFARTQLGRAAVRAG